MSLPVTLAVFVVALAIFVAATIVGRRPAVPGRVRLIPMGLVQFVALLAVLLMAGHLISLLSGTPFTSRNFG